MKKILLGFMLAFILATATASAVIYNPLPINGKVTGGTISNVEVKATNVRTGISMTATTNADGEYLMDWANSNDKSGTLTKYFNGDTFKIELVYCSGKSPDCSKEVQYIGQPEIFTKFEVDFVCPDCPTCEVCAECEICPIPTDPSFSWLLFLSGGGVIALLTYLGLRYGAYKGKMRIQVYKKTLNTTTGKYSYSWKTLWQTETGKEPVKPAT